MKYKITFCLFALLSIQFCSAQKEKALQYYNLCNKAELAICDSNIKGALEYYQRAFLINPSKPFSQDLLNAFHCAIDNNEFDEAEKYLQRILYRGVKQKYLHRQILDFYKGDKLGKIVAMLKKHPNDSIRLNPYSLKMNDLLRRDQGARRYFTEKGLDNYMTDSVKHNDKIVSNELYKYFLEYGVKNIDSIGHFGGEINNDVVYYVIILHQKQTASLGEVKQMDFDSLFYPAIFMYDFHPKYFLSQFNQGNKEAFLEKYPALMNLHGLEGANYNDTLFVQNLDSIQLKSINNAYQLIGLPSYAETIKKVAFRNKCEFIGGSLTKYKMINTICSICFCETEEEFFGWKKKIQKNHK